MCTTHANVTSAVIQALRRAGTAKVGKIYRGRYKAVLFRRGAFGLPGAFGPYGGEERRSARTGHRCMSKAIVSMVLAAAVGVAVAAEAPLPDPAYCSLRDADPAKCMIRDSVPVPFVVPTPEAAAPAAGVDYCSLRDADPRKCVIQDGATVLRRATPSSSTGSSANAQRAPTTPVLQSPPIGAVNPAPGTSSFGGSADTPSALVPQPGNTTRPGTVLVPPSSTTTPLPGTSSFGGSADTPSALVPPSGVTTQPGSVLAPPTSTTTPLPGTSSFGGSVDTPAALAPPRNTTQSPSSSSGSSRSTAPAQQRSSGSR